MKWSEIRKFLSILKDDEIDGGIGQKQNIRTAFQALRGAIAEAHREVKVPCDLKFIKNKTSPILGSW